MQIILLEKIVNLGNLGDVVNVKNGYARNFLIPQGKAKRATPANLAEFELKKAEYLRKQDAILANAQERHAKLNEQLFTVSAKAGVDGKLFGSVTSFDIVEAVKHSGVEITKAEVSLPNGPLKTLGEFEVSVLLHHDVHAKIKVNVTAYAV